MQQHSIAKELVSIDVDGVAEIVEAHAEDLVLERLPSGDYAWLRREKPSQCAPAIPESALSRWCERLRCATRFTMPKGWAMVDVPVVALEDLRA